jgi:hypothetical protein
MYKEKSGNPALMSGYTEQQLCLHALAGWRSGHRILLRNRRPGFESRQVTFKVHSNAAMYNRLCMHCLCFEIDK